MLRRVVPPVYSSVSPVALIAAAFASIREKGNALHDLHGVLRDQYRADSVLLTDSGTSALVLALRALVGQGGTVAYPGYGCVDLAAAAAFAGVKVRLYDLDPATLSPDMESVQSCLHRGVAAIVVVHFFGYPADVTEVMRMAQSSGAYVIEDGAQAAGGRMDSNWLGSAGDATILSFGRGKGTTGGGGGAVLFRGNDGHADASADKPLPLSGIGWSSIAKLAAQLLLGKPALYGIPSAIPQLKLGEMVYHPAHEPQGISLASARLVVSAIARTTRDVSVRTKNARILADACKNSSLVQAILELPGAAPGYLRFPLRLRKSGDLALPTQLGVVRPYPRALHDQPELQPALLPNEPVAPGAAELASRLVTLPTHSYVALSDMQRLIGWIRLLGTGNTQ